VTKWGYNAVLKTGTQCIGSMEDFKNGDAQLLIANIKCIAEGYNLQERCNHMIFLSNTWSLKDRMQVEARIYRIGQKRKCMYIDYLYKGTIDEHVLVNMEAKREVFNKAQKEARGFKW
jgi:SNF2 family DNA or RNA helicase